MPCLSSRTPGRGNAGPSSLCRGSTGVAMIGATEIGDVGLRVHSPRLSTQAAGRTRRPKRRAAQGRLPLYQSVFARLMSGRTPCLKASVMERELRPRIPRFPARYIQLPRRSSSWSPAAVPGTGRRPHFAVASSIVARADEDTSATATDLLMSRMCSPPKARHRAQPGFRPSWARRSG